MFSNLENVLLSLRCFPVSLFTRKHYVFKICVLSSSDWLKDFTRKRKFLEVQIMSDPGSDFQDIASDMSTIEQNQNDIIGRLDAILFEEEKGLN